MTEVIITLFVIDAFVILIGRKQILKVAKKFDEVVEELRKNN